MLTPSGRVKAILNELIDSGDLTHGYFFLGGSSGLALRDIRHVGDIDVGVPTRAWHDLNTQRILGFRPWKLVTTALDDDRRRCDPPYLCREVLGTEVHVFHSWRWRGKDETSYNDFNLAFTDGIELVEGWPCIRLKVLLKMKADAIQFEPHRAKDLADIKLIADAIAAE